ncbi:hypothetical protein RJ639_016065 [Escallonia herrerae]|uniref:Uncharacterized protein n=1 Tax=Escallonia herrerae TaxID=1293975 RepID=A0AA89ALP0_9ASTE|nr:hypothetical protein RJ639_016065 [Escallonia herrerae]
MATITKHRWPVAIGKGPKISIPHIANEIGEVKILRGITDVLSRVSAPIIQIALGHPKGVSRVFPWGSKFLWTGHRGGLVRSSPLGTHLSFEGMSSSLGTVPLVRAASISDFSTRDTGPDGAGMKVQISSRKLVKPSVSTPSHLRSCKLSFFDQLAPQLHVPLVFFYPASDGTKDESSCDHLEKALSETLSRFYPLSWEIC